MILSTPDQKLGPKRRVKKRKDFIRVQSNGRKVRSSFFLLTFSKSRDNSQGICVKYPDAARESPPDSRLADSRLGVTITTKVDKSAARRNKLKRRIREVFRLNRVKIKDGVDLVVIALNGSSDLKYKEIRREILGLFRKARLFK